MTTDLLAIDIGYGYTKAMTHRERVIFPSMVGPAEQIRFESDMMANNGNGITLEVDGRRYFVGERAALQSASASQTLATARTGSVEQTVLFHAAASDLVRTTADHVIVVTGLPVADFDERKKAALEEVFLGREHLVQREGKHRRRFRVTNLYIVPQAFGSLFSLVLNRRGKAENGDLTQGRVGIVDVGTFTTNFILADRLRYVESGSDSITSGMSEMLGKTAKDLKREFDLDWIGQLGRVDHAVRDRSVEVYGEQVDIATIVDHHLNDLGQTIVSKALSLWDYGADLKAVIVTGGGSLEITRYLQAVYPHAQRVAGDPQFANVEGFLRAGLRRFRSV